MSAERETAMSSRLEQRSERKRAFRPTRRSLHRSDDDMAAAIERLVRALGRRLEEDDPEHGVPLLRRVDEETYVAWARAIAGWRRSGFTNAEIGRVLGTTGQNVGQRWPRTDDHLYLGDGSSR